MTQKTYTILKKNVLYLYETITEKIIIGKFCQIASGIRFLTPGGNPAKPIRKRFDEATIELLLKICWWDWPIEKITQNLESIVNGDIRE